MKLRTRINGFELVGILVVIASFGVGLFIHGVDRWFFAMAGFVLAAAGVLLWLSSLIPDDHSDCESGKD
jgi:ABC-type multidrug transport system permease subunit